MRISHLKHIISLLALWVIAAFNAPSSQAETVVQATTKTMTSGSIQSLPHAEMEIVKQHGSAGYSANIQKKCSATSFSVTGPAQKLLQVSDVRIRGSLRLQKNYLFHIYPFHAFW